MKTLRGYHFTGTALRNGDPIPPVGTWLEHKGAIAPCEYGLHMSEEPYDALQFAPGHLLHRVELRGDLIVHGNPTDKWVGRERKIIASIDATKLLRQFAREMALSVVHLWDAPDVVKRFLETGDESLRAAARAAAWDAVLDAAWAAACAAAYAACDAACDAAWDAAWAARAAACDAARAAAWDAVLDAARKQFNEMVAEAFKKV